MRCQCGSCSFLDRYEKFAGRSGNFWDSDGYDGYGGHTACNGVSYGNFREKSDAALRRERTAKEKFNALADATPANISGFTNYRPFPCSPSEYLIRSSARSATHTRGSGGSKRGHTSVPSSNGAPLSVVGEWKTDLDSS